MNSYQDTPGDFQVAPGSQLFIKIDGFESRLKSMFIGGQLQAYLIVTTPKVDGIESAVFEGVPVSVTFLHDGVVYGFRSRIIHRLITPARLLFLAYPPNIEKHELRKHQRVECNLPAMIRIQNGASDFEGIMANISTGGCKVIFLASSEIVHETMASGTKIQISFELAGIGSVKLLEGIIKSFSAEGSKLALGISFEQANHEDALTKVEHYMHNVMRFHG